jgi:Rrf2 family iron-sulfur cluster assembly transcriptional regulator
MLSRRMRFSLQSQYAICGVFDLAYHGRDKAVQVRVVGERQGIPTGYLEQIFQRLRRAELVVAKRGPGGGYRLARPAGQISLLEIVEAVEGSLAPFAGLGGSQQKGAAHRPDFLWEGLTRQLADVLGATSIEALCSGAARSAVPRAGVEAFEYQI